MENIDIRSPKIIEKDIFYGEVKIYTQRLLLNMVDTLIYLKFEVDNSGDMFSFYREGLDSSEGRRHDHSIEIRFPTCINNKLSNGLWFKINKYVYNKVNPAYDADVKYIYSQNIRILKNNPNIYDNIDESFTQFKKEINKIFKHELRKMKLENLLK